MATWERYITGGSPSIIISRAFKSYLWTYSCANRPPTDPYRDTLFRGRTTSIIAPWERYITGGSPSPRITHIPGPIGPLSSGGLDPCRPRTKRPPFGGETTSIMAPWRRFIFISLPSGSPLLNLEYSNRRRPWHL